MRVVFDTNIFVSALVFPGSRADEALTAGMDGRIELVISKPIIHEVLEVLARKFAHDPEALARVAVFLAELATLVHPRRRLHILSDEPDNRILECAVAAHAPIIVTGDRAMLALKAYGDIRITSLKTFLELLEE
ncbi:MAG: putative toxin-antitoxin system toxin component, PIN family [Gammaproteobacteria bacterium]|nr:putative toxin-antitoxin system toxin component, PIN family [Gammaproteobacteria bacterium]